MGYSEVLCHICGVSFNIGRIRTPTEPRSAAWSRFGPIQSNYHVVDGQECRYKRYYSYVDGGRNSWIGECPREAGCMFTFRKVKDEGAEVAISRRGRRILVVKGVVIEEDEAEDGDWEQEDDEEDDEPLEYDSDLEEETTGDPSDVEMEDAEHAEHRSVEREEWRRFCIRALMTTCDSQLQFGQDNDAHPAWYRGNIIVDRIDDIQDEMFPLFYPGRDNDSEHGTDGSASDDEISSPQSRKLDHYIGGKLGYYPKQKYDVEHIAGPGCLNRGGYSGHEITVEEMRGCQVSQCLVRKLGTFEPLEDDEEFEKKGNFFLSGLSDYMPSRDDNHPLAKPPRHLCERPRAENAIWDEQEIEEYAMPFHPWCFEIFKRTSTIEYGSIDVDGLTSWWLDNARKHRFDENCNDEDVNSCKQQEWDHWKGTEYLAANPLYVPRLRDIFEQAISTAPGFSPRNGAFPVSLSTSAVKFNDPFARLPAELQFEILDGLHSRDIASLRLVSRTFRQLPISYFQKLLNREMPWLWEARPTPTRSDYSPYSFWTTVTAGEAERKLQKTQKAIASLHDYVRIVSTEMPELKDVLEPALRAEIRATLDAHQLEVENDEDRKPFFLPPDGTDYHLVYLLMKRHWTELRGLRNRRKIWRECQGIAKKVKRMRKSGKIGPLVR